MHYGVTGATGFIGKAVVSALPDDKLTVFGRSQFMGDIGPPHVYMDLADLSDFDGSRFAGVDVVVHCAALVHVLGRTPNPEEYIRINTDATIRLAELAEVAGVKRFIFLSSVKACRASMSAEAPALDESAELQPSDDFGRSKAKAEELLLSFSRVSDIEVVIIRAPLVYGEGVAVNFEAMLKLAKSGIPLPFGRFDENIRSLVYIENLTDFVRLCCVDPAAAGHVFHVADMTAVSTRCLFDTMRGFMGLPSRLINIPVGWVYCLFYLLGRGSDIKLLNGTLLLDCKKARKVLGWLPPVSYEVGMGKTIESFMCKKESR